MTNSLLEMRLPHMQRGVEKVRVVRWLKSSGDRLEPGEDVLVVDTEPRLKLDIPRSAKLLSKVALAKQATTTRQVDIRVRLRITAAEPATLVETTAAEGTICSVGDLLGKVTPAAGDSSTARSNSTMRVVINEEGL